MFNKKNDPLVESVKAVMKQNEVHRQAEAALNEELGISSKKALPHEYHAQYDALLEAKVKRADEVLAGQRVRNIVGAAADETVKKIKGALSKKPKKPIDPYEEMVKREIPEETDYSPKQKKLAMLGNAAGHGGDPEEIDGPDLSAARKGHAHKVGLEEKKLTSAETSKKEELVKKMKKGDWSKRYGERGKEVMYATATKMAKKLAEEAATGVQKFTKRDARYVALQAGHRDKDTLHIVVDQIRDHINGGGSPELRKAFHMNPRDNKIHKEIYNAATKLDEAEGDINPSEMTPISKGLQDRIVKDPPKPKPETKNMEEGVAMIRAGTAAKMAYGTTKQPRTRIGSEQKEPNETTVGVMKSFLRRQEKKKDKSVAESVIDEIRENLEANLIAIHESGDDELFENYVNSLTEEELDILGLTEDWRSAAFGDNTSGGSLSNIGYRTPSSVAAAQARGAARTQQQARPTPSATPTARPAPSATPAARPVPSPVAAKPATSSIEKPQQLSGPGSTATPRPAPSSASTARPVPAITPAAKPAASTSLDIRDPGTGEITGKRDPGTGEVISSTPEIKAPEKKPLADLTGGGPIIESTKPQIKESLESFLRNRFLKG